MTAYDHAGATNNCPSGKRAYVCRKDAKRAAQEVRARKGEHLRPYVCDACLLWHCGHLPQAVLRGVKTARQVYGR